MRHSSDMLRGGRLNARGTWMQQPVLRVSMLGARGRVVNCQTAPADKQHNMGTAATGAGADARRQSGGNTPLGLWASETVWPWVRGRCRGAPGGGQRAPQYCWRRSSGGGAHSVR